MALRCVWSGSVKPKAFHGRRVTKADRKSNTRFGDGQRRSLRRFASPVVSGTRYGLTVELISDLAYTLAAGHRLGLIITSSNFPRFAQNPNNGDPFIGGSPPVFVTNTLYLDGMSAIVLAVGP